jgi:hypothetical protein
MSLFRPNRRLLLAYLSPFYTRIRHRSLFDHLTRFCLFIGHGRSGSTLVGALLNAHPSVVMSNELDVLEYVKLDLTREQLFNLIYYMSRRQVRRGSPGGGGYSYAVPGQWQGRHRVVRVIGDRRAGSTAIQLFRQPGLLPRLQDTARIPLSFVCVVRNPFDTIATTFRKTTRLANESPDDHMRRQIARYFERWTAIARVVEQSGKDSVAFVFHEALAADPSGVLSQLCAFLDIGADAAYLADCASIVRRDPHITRTSIDWPPHLVELVRHEMAEVPWLRGDEL